MLFSKKFMIPLLFLSIALLMLTSFSQEKNQEAEEPQTQEKEVVATIDDKEIYMSELNQMTNLQQTMMQLQQRNPQFVRFLYTSPEGQNFLEAFKKNQLEDLITRKLLEREAQRENIRLTKKDKEKYFKEQIDMIKQQQNMSDEELLKALNQQGIESMDAFKKIFIEQQGESLKIHKLIEEVVLDKVKVSDKEAEQWYDQGQYQVEFKEVKDQIKRELAQKEYIDQLREEADINILIE